MGVKARLRSRTRWFVIPVVTALAGVGMVGLPGAALANGGSGPVIGHGSQVIGHVYIDGNNAGANTIAVFDRHADGSLTANAGSPGKSRCSSPRRRFRR